MGGGLIGRGGDENKPFSQIPLDIFSKEQLLKILLCTPEELRKIADVIEKERR